VKRFQLLGESSKQASHNLVTTAADIVMQAHDR